MCNFLFWLFIKLKSVQESYEQLPVEQKVSILLGAVSNAAEIPTEGRSLAAVMLRRLFSNEFEEFFGKVSCHIAFYVSFKQST